MLDQPPLQSRILSTPNRAGGWNHPSLSALVGAGGGGGGFSAEPELSAWVARVQGRGSNVTGTGVQTAVGNLIIGLKTDLLWDMAWRIGVYAGDALAALEAPLLISAADVATDTLTGFVAGDYTSTGLVGGAGKRILTGFNWWLPPVYSTPNPLLNINSFSIGLYTRTATAAGAVQMGTQQAGNAASGCYLSHDASTVNAEMWDITAGVSVADASGVGFYLLSRTASNALKLYKNGSQIGSTSTSPGGAVNGFSFAVHDGNLSNSAWAPTSQSICFYWIGKGLDATQAANLRTRVQTLQTALSRQV